MDEKIRAKFFSRRFSGIQHTIKGRNGKELEDDLFVDVDPMNYEVWITFIFVHFEMSFNGSLKRMLNTFYQQYKGLPIIWVGCGIL